MEFISSDTNVWIDFNTINQLELPFKLPYTYIMYNESIENELLNPKDFKEKLLAAGLVGIEITIQEFILADQWGSVYPKLSIPDRIALAIAKTRQIPLLTGDGELRKAAKNENVAIMGTIKILDILHDEQYISDMEYTHCLNELLKHNGGVVRLPTKALQERLDKMSQP